MDSETPANRSRIPRVNFGSQQVVKPSLLVDVPVSNGIMTDKAPVRRALVAPARATQKVEPSKVRQNLIKSLKRPFNNAQENAPDIKKRAMAPPSNPKGKLPAWDIKGKLKQAEDRNACLKQQIESATSESSEMRMENANLKHQVHSLSSELMLVKSDLESKTRQLLDSREETESLRVKYNESERALRNASFSLESANQTLSLKEERLKMLCVELDEIKETKIQKEAAFLTQQKLLKETEESLKHYQDECHRLQERVRTFEVQRKVLHNKVMELKGNIRVFCRVRPLLPSEMSHSKSLEHLTFIDENSLEVCKGAKKTKSSFSFDRVFPPSAKQMDVFEELSELVQSVVDGYNVCVFAYGQTGSGKTYTMEGGFGQEFRGMIPRSVDLVFDKLNELETIGWTCQVEASFIEIYNEQIRDLLGASQADKPCEIRNPASPGGDMVVTNVKVQEVKSASQVNELLNTARTNRAVAATVHNDHSSRSHFVFKLTLRTSNSATGKTANSMLSLVDLAGSERLVDISENERVTETKNINKSLSNVGNVILALSRKNEHVPYRNSKLTHLLQPSLGGNSKTLMLVTVSPKEECVDETMNSLRFAMRVNECHVGRARRQVK